MRCIDADELLKQPLDMANYPSNFVHNAPTVKVVPIDKLEEIKAELPDHSFWQDAGGEPLVAIRDVLEIIDRKIAEVTKNERN